MAGLIHSFRLAVMGLAAAVALSSCGAAAPVAAPDKTVVLTVTGAIGNTNRGPIDEFQDAFIGHKGMKFDRAFEFSRADLAALGMREVRIQRANWPKPVTVRGPAFKEVLAAVKAEGDTVVLQALDGYQSTFPITGLQADTVLLAIEADGKPLAIGGRGPTWLVFPAGAIPGDDKTGDAGLAWSVFHIDVTKDPVAP